VSHCLAGLLLVLGVTGCAGLSAQRDTAAGTSALTHGDYATAIARLHAALARNPRSSVAANNLASAYFASGRAREGWPYVRQALIIAPRNRPAHANLLRFFAELVHQGELGDGVGVDTVREWLGAPDSVTADADGALWRYGPVGLRVRGGRLSGQATLDPPPTRRRAHICQVCRSEF